MSDAEYNKIDEIRQLVEGYYDIQKLRIESWNRIVAYVMAHAEDLKALLSKMIKESHKNVETHCLHASHKRCETQPLSASQLKRVTQEHHASHEPFATHHKDASHRRSATHNTLASHRKIESHIPYASHGIDATHKAIANLLDESLRLLEKKRYSEFAKKFILSHNKFETHSKYASHEEDETHIAFASHKNLETHVSDAFSDISDLLWFYDRLHRTEVELGKRIDRWSKSHPLRVQFLLKVTGIGGILSSGLIAWLSDSILKSEHVSSVWRFCGLTPDSKRIAGQKLDYNPRLKSFCWKIGKSFIKFDCFGRKLYLEFKRVARLKHPVEEKRLDVKGKPMLSRGGKPLMQWTDGHVDAYARRKVVKLFLAAVWEKWRKMNSLPVGKTYPIVFMGHDTVITPDRWLKEGKPDE